MSFADDLRKKTQKAVSHDTPDWMELRSILYRCIKGNCVIAAKSGESQIEFNFDLLLNALRVPDGILFDDQGEPYTTGEQRVNLYLRLIERISISDFDDPIFSTTRLTKDDAEDIGFWIVGQLDLMDDLDAEFTTPPVKNMVWDNDHVGLVIKVYW